MVTDGKSFLGSFDPNWKFFLLSEIWANVLLVQLCIVLSFPIQTWFSQTQFLPKNGPSPTDTSQGTADKLQYVLACLIHDTEIPTTFVFSALWWAVLLSEKRIAHYRFSKNFQYPTPQSLQSVKWTGKLCLTSVLIHSLELLLHCYHYYCCGCYCGCIFLVGWYLTLWK